MTSPKVGSQGLCVDLRVHLVVDLSSVSSVDQLGDLGLDILKEELSCRGLKRSGSLMERAALLFSIKRTLARSDRPGAAHKAHRGKEEVQRNQKAGFSDRCLD